ncbi:hypothetical protein QUR14_004365 [Enterobacter hormaechei]|nr:hypothetical protein [Enterobacter hormaechei]HBC0589355.1 hypothetical protein [Enterobacter cloacae]
MNLISLVQQIGKILVLFFLVMVVIPVAMADTLMSQKTTPVSVVFGIRSLSPDTSVDTQRAFVSQNANLPDVICTSCDAKHTRWESEWLSSGVKYRTDVSRPEIGWYVFSSGLDGIGISIKTQERGQKTTNGDGNRANLPSEFSAGLVRLAQNTGAGLAELPAAEFRRLTTFYDESGQALYSQEDTVRVSADLHVPTCTSSAGGLKFILPEISQVWLKRNVAVGTYTDTVSSPPQLVVANCSSNTSSLRIRFIPSGPVFDSSEGNATILVGHSTQTGRDTGVGYLMKYSADGFGTRRTGIVHWDSLSPLVITNSRPYGDGEILNQGIIITLQVFYARPKNNLEISAGQIEAKGIYQVSYE